jgi:hypothetical protein
LEENYYLYKKGDSLLRLEIFRCTIFADPNVEPIPGPVLKKSVFDEL